MTRKTLEHGRRIRETLKQPQYEPMPAAEQVAVLLAATSGILDSVPLEEIAESKRAIQKAFSERLPELGRRISSAERLNPGDREAILEMCKDVLKK